MIVSIFDIFILSFGIFLTIFLVVIFGNSFLGLLYPFSIRLDISILLPISELIKLSDFTNFVLVLNI